MRLQQLAAAKMLPVKFLEALGVKEDRASIAIPYYDQARKIVRVRLRAGKKFWWNGTGAIVPYGLDRLDQARRERRLFLVEGESDCWTLWHCGMPALGLPGATTANCLQREALDSIDQLYLHREPDEAGGRFVELLAARLRELAFAGEVYEMRSGDGCKDPSDWFVKLKGDQLNFIQLWNRAAKLAAKLFILKPKPSPIEQDRRPKIEVTTEEIAVNDQAVAALARDTTIYQRSGQLVQVLTDIGPSIRPVPAAVLREKLTAAAAFIKTRHTKEGRENIELIHPPDWCVRAVESRGDWPGIRRLAGVTEFPVFLRDGSILSKPGYDADSQLLLTSATDLDVPTRPRKQDVYAALDQLGEVLVDFPFADASAQAGWVAALLTPLARFAYEGPTPLFLIDANTRGSGKTLLVQTIATILTGRPAAAVSYPDTNEDRRKIVTSIAASGLQLVFLDNLAGLFGDKVLDQALTSTFWRDRVFHSQRMADYPLTAVWYATGNNVSVVADTGRRVLPIRLESPLEHPETRAGFRHPDLLAWCRENRSALLSAALTVLRGWHVAGRPAVSLKPWGSYEGWSACVRAALVWAGVSDPREACGTVETQVDSEAANMATLLELWERLDTRGTGLSVAEVLESQQDNWVRTETEEQLHRLLAELLRKPDARSLALLLRKYRRRVLNGRFIDIKAKVAGFRRWQVYPARQLGAISQPNV